MLYISLPPSIKYSLSLLKEAEIEMLNPQEQSSDLEERQMLNDPELQLKEARKTSRGIINTAEFSRQE